MKLFTLFFFITLSLYAPETKMPLKKLERHRGNEKVLKKINRQRNKCNWQTTRQISRDNKSHFELSPEDQDFWEEEYICLKKQEKKEEKKEEKINWDEEYRHWCELASYWLKLNACYVWEVPWEFQVGYEHDHYCYWRDKCEEVEEEAEEERIQTLVKTFAKEIAEYEKINMQQS